MPEQQPSSPSLLCTRVYWDYFYLIQILQAFVLATRCSSKGQKLAVLLVILTGTVTTH